MNKGQIEMVPIHEVTAKLSEMAAERNAANKRVAELEAALKEEQETTANLVRALAEEVNGPTFMGEPVTAATQARPASGEAWISLEERVPNEDTDVLLCMPDGARLVGYRSYYDGGYYNDGESGVYWYDGDHDPIDSDEPTHWMPLPAAPTSTPSAASPGTGTTP